jgi:hypothetical protein
VLVVTYKQLLRHRETSKLALRLEQRQIGEQLDRELIAAQTDQFLSGQIEEARRRLMEREKARLAKGRSASWDQAEDELLVENYRQLLSKQEAARLALRLEQRQLGEQFKIIEGARLPERPIGPRLFPYLVLGALAGISTGVLLSLLATLWRRRRARLPPAVAH